MTSHAPRAWWLETAPYARRKPHALASTPATPKEKHSLLFGFARDQFLLKRKGHFLLVFCPPSIRAGGGANADEVLRKLFFGERISQNTRLIFFEFGCRKWKRRGLGRNFPFAPLISFGEIRAGLHLSYQITFTQSPPDRFLTYIKNSCEIFYILISIFDFFVQKCQRHK